MSWSICGVQMKGRLDWLAGVKAIVDLKSTKDASRKGFGKEVANYETLAQAALYSDGHFVITGERWPYLLLAAEPFAPYAAQIYRVPEWQLEIGRRTYMGWLETLATCLKTDTWPAYGIGEMELELPTWLTGETT